MEEKSVFKYKTRNGSIIVKTAIRIFRNPSTELKRLAMYAPTKKKRIPFSREDSYERILTRGKKRNIMLTTHINADKYLIFLKKTKSSLIILLNSYNAAVYSGNEQMPFLIGGNMSKIYECMSIKQFPRMS